VIILLSPAKSLDFSPHGLDVAATRPPLLERTEAIAKKTRSLTRPKIKALMNVSDDLADLTHQRFQAFDPDRAPNAPAAFAFAGDVYRGLDARSLTEQDLAWAQDHVRILSGLYGVLRPLDGIQPYRLEMGTRLKIGRKKNLYEFWGADIAEEIGDAAGDGVVINLASNEYFDAVDTDALDARIITPAFKEITDKGAKVMQYYAKHARGAMTRWIIENRIDDPKRIKEFDRDGYRFDEALTRGDAWTFSRPKPEPKNS